MNEIREIVTKAVIGKGKKTIRLKEVVTPHNEPFSILGCWGINNQYRAKQIDENVVEIVGNFEINIWYSSDNNTKTEVVKKIINYKDTIKTKEIVKEKLSSSNEVIVRMLQEPTCTNAYINGYNIEVDIVFEVLVEVIGETKVKVTVYNAHDAINDLDDEDFENEINENFLEDINH
ncbi:MAG: outer spore coat protein CotE [Acholeplasmataceae bacterium]|nr:outer spore coat protein CotE [Acholeplasmataceae bacterium]HOA63573.1 outer spore coat protein CotE [Bacilli bacterium]HPT88984.1 outer spore coat protein CotE [Bacilli bacterium]HQA19771.1 outer spore coat protein CotE [Bacilli bacterium]HQD92206.1 outer spore coat protein CotE [Bacilli bacterium]